METVRSDTAIRGARITLNWTIPSFVLFAIAFVLCGEESAVAAVPAKAVIWGALALSSYLIGLLCLITRGGTPLSGLTRRAPAKSLLA